MEGKHLSSFFRAKAHENVVFSVADILSMGDVAADDFASHVLADYDPSESDVRLSIQEAGARHGGFILIPMSRIASASHEFIAWLHAFGRSYVDSRRSRGVPFVDIECGCVVDGEPSQRCEACDGTGTIRVVVEMSDRERSLAEGVA